MPEEVFVSFGEMARSRLQEQAQYASRFIDGRHGCPSLGDGLRFQGAPKDYHDVRIHRDDVEEFVKRYADWNRESGIYRAE